MKIATWNVNSIKVRLDTALAWLKDAKPDVVALQEIKCVDENFPAEAFEALGYNCAVHGQKTYNGVAILSKRPLEDVTPRLPGGDGDDHARYLEAVVTGDKGTLRLASIYLPNGNPIGTEKFAYKLAWMERLQRHAKELLANEEPVALIGDYNVIPQDQDCYDPKAWVNDALFQPQSKAALRAIEYLGFTDAFRARNSQAGQYTFWDYQAGAWRKNQGIRIDHILLSPQGLDRLKDCGIDKHMREGDKPSDHVPVWAELDI
ncbi:MAG TPA: exodeoxyribonuclease III [Rhizomicrobium sp.]|jgi:exodeoxyribonuclease-3|nr:exodeoxyribonuclease III [Rhizomicrobium sp.]